MNSAKAHPSAAFSSADGLALAVVAVVSLIMMVPQQTNWDVSWYIILCERLLAGAVYGVDFIEVNPPAALWLYLGPTALARGIGASPEAVVVATVYFVLGGSCWLTWRILRNDRASQEWLPVFIVVMVVAFGVMPGRDFAQREHFAQMLLLPYAAIALARAGGANPAPWSIIIVALCGGVMASIKPMFVLVAMVPPLVAAGHARNWRLVFAPEACGAAAVFLAYGALAYLLYPAFLTESLPLIFSLYTADKWFNPLVEIEILVWCAALLTALALRAARTAAPAMFVACSLAFFVCYILQAKGFYYHRMPVLTMLALALAVQWRQLRRPVSRALTLILLGLLVGSPLAGGVHIDHAPLAAAIRANGAGATVMLLGSTLHSAHPAVRMAGARWVSRLPAGWAVDSHRRLQASASSPETQAERDRHAAETLKILLEDLRNNKPDVLLIERAHWDWAAALQQDPEFARELAKYRVHSSGYKLFNYSVEVLVRTPQGP